jgi:thiol-disulfide isomerase/thioredoxin
MTKTKLILIIAVLYNSIFIFSGAMNWLFQLCCVSIITYVTLYYLIKELGLKTYLAFLIILPANLLYDLNALIQGLIHVYPIVIFPMLAAILALVTLKLNGKFKIGVMAFIILIFTLPTSMFMEFWLTNTRLDKTAWNEFELDKSVVLTNENGDSVNITNSKDTLIVMDAWTTSCGICFKKLPQFKELSIRYENNPMIKFYTVNFKLKRDTPEKTHAIIKEYFSNNLFIQDSLESPRFYVDRVPCYIIIKNGKVLFKGTTNVLSSFYKHDLEEEINKHLTN